MLILTLFSLSTTSLGQTHDFRFLHYSQEDGLSQSIIRKIVQTRDGFLWFATEDGLNRFDGQRFKVYRKRRSGSSLSWNHVYDMVEDTVHSRLWLGTSFKGVDILDLAADTFSVVPGPGSPRRLPDENVTAIAFLGPLALVGTRTALSVIDSRSGTITDIIPSVSPVRSIIPEVAAGKAFAFCENGDLLTFEAATRRRTLLPAGNYLGPTARSLWKTFRDRRGVYWICTRNGLFRAPSYADLRPGGTIPFRLKHEGEDYSGRYYNCVYLDSRDRYWVSVDSIGLFLLDASLRPVRRISHAADNRYSPSDNNIYQVFEDASRNIWFATEKGVDKITHSHPSIRSYGQEDSRTRDVFNRVFSLGTASNGSLLIGHQGNVQWYDPATDRFGTAENRTGIDFGRTYFFHPIGSDVFLTGTREGAFLLERRGAGWRISRSPRLSGLEGLQRITCIRDLSDGTFLIGTLDSRGLLRWNPRTRSLVAYRHVPSDPASIANDNVLSITRESSRGGGIWVTTQAGFSRFDPVTGRFTNHQVLVDGKPKVCVVNDAHDDGQGLWLSVYQEGLLRWNRPDGRQQLYTEDDGLPETSLYNLRADTKGNIWIASNHGLIRFDTSSRRFGRLTMNDGLPSEEFNRFAVCTRGSRAYFGGIGGIVEVDGGAYESLATTMPVTITELQYLDSSRFHPLVDLSGGITLPHHAHTFTLGFAMLDFRQPGYHRYRYRLMGWDRDWIYGETRNTVTYSNLAPGDYTFLVEPDDDHAHAHAQPTRLAIRVVPRWYQTILFKTTSVMALLILLALTGRFYILYRTRRRQAEIERKLAIQYERQRISADLHDEIGSTLSSVNIYAGMARQQLEDKGLLHPIIDNVNQVIQRLDELVWSIRPTQDTLGTLIERFSTFATPTARSLGVDLVMEGATGNEGVLLEPDTRHHLYMMMKELVNNAIRHSGCRSVRVAVLREGDTLMVMVQDDGHGFDAGKARRNRNGLRNLQMRAEEMRARFDVQSKVGSGTIARIRVPLSN